MEEVDNIIIDSLKNIHCDIDEEIHSLKDFTVEMAFESIVICLETITPGAKFSHKLPPSMSLRLKLATNIAEHIKELGYRDDMGYQTILYCNEVEIRRVLMFLVERLPRETHKTVICEELGYVSKLVKEIEQRIQLSITKPWVPSGALKQGIRHCQSLSLRQDFGYCYPLQTMTIEIPNLKLRVSEELRHYWVHNLPDINKQCASKDIIPSLLFKDAQFTKDMLKIKDTLVLQQNHVNVGINESNFTQNHKESSNLQHTTSDNVEENKLQLTATELENTKRTFEELQQNHRVLSDKLMQLEEQKLRRESTLKETIQKVKTRSKTLAILSSEDNLTKLKQLIENGNKRLIELANQWYQVQEPLLKQYQELQQNLSNQEHKIIDEKQKLQNVKDKYNQLTQEVKEKEKLEQSLTEEYQQLNKNTNRSAYTRRILEIIGNIKKQNDEIQNILNDTKTVQKEINNLNGRLDRSFTLSDELIFRDAKRDEMARKAYKLLATLHSDCGTVVQAVTDLGLTERECRNLQEQVDTELTKETSIKLEKVTKDLMEVKKEIAAMIKQIKGQT